MNSLHFKYGFRIFLGLAVYFLAMELLGLSHLLFLRFLNILIIGFGLYHAVNENYEEGNHVFIENFLFCMLTSIVALVLSAFALSYYIHYMGGEKFLNSLGKVALLSSENLGISTYCVGIFFEGVASSVITTYFVLYIWEIKHAKYHLHLE